MSKVLPLFFLEDLGFEKWMEFRWDLVSGERALLVGMVGLMTEFG